MKFFSFITSVALAAGLTRAPAGADTTLIASVASNAVPAFQDLGAA